MTSAQAVETSVTNNSSFQNNSHSHTLYEQFIDVKIDANQ